MIEVAVEHRSLLAEGPIWDSKNNSICWVDILKGEIHELEVGGNIFKTTKIQQLVGAIALCTHNNFLVAMKSGIGILDRQTGEIGELVHPESHLPENRFNDGKCDPVGRFWVGTMSLNEKPNAGSLYMLDSNQIVSKKIKETTISNGMAWSPDQRVFYFIDTPTFQVVAYCYDKESGSIQDRKVVITIPEEDGYPDGMTIDADGKLWIAHWDGWQISRWDPLTGMKLFTLCLPVAKVTSCVFGGEDLQDLYITTAKEGLSEQEHSEQPLAGSLFVWKDCGYKGIPAFEYKV